MNTSKSTITKMTLLCCTVWLSIIGQGFSAPTPGTAAVNTKPHWTYQGLAGPDAWATGFPSCAGTRQSPIDIRPEACQYDPTLNASPLRLVNFTMKSTRAAVGQGSFLCTITNNGHSATAMVSGNMVVEGGVLPGKFRTAGFHFHWGSHSAVGSEHALGGVKYPLEMHVVNWNTKYGSLTNAVDKPDGLAVLAVMFDISSRDNLLFEPLRKALQNITRSGDYQMVDGLTIRSLLPTDVSRYYRYLGSLTTPVCYESVIWTVFAQPQKISEKQLASLRRLRYDASHVAPSPTSGPISLAQLVDNWRPLQPLHGRVVRQSFPVSATLAPPPTRSTAAPTPVYVPMGGLSQNPAKPGAVFQDNTVD